MKFNQDELACRMLEAATRFKRPASLTPTEALNQHKVLGGSYRRAAAEAIRYFIACAGSRTMLPEPVDPPLADNDPQPVIRMPQ